VFFVGFAAISQVPGLQVGDIDLALLKVSVQTFDPWFVGVIGAAGLLTALVPGSMILTSAATMLANDLYRGAYKKDASDAAVKRLAILLVPLVALLLMGYNFVTQLARSLFFSFLERNPVTNQGAFCGILAGALTVAAIVLSKVTLAQMLPFLPEALRDLNVGVVALVVNLCVTALVSGLTSRRATTAATAV